MFLRMVLFKEVEKNTDIPTSCRCSLMECILLQPDVSLNHYQLQDGCVIDLSVRGIGGAGSDTGVVLVN